MLAEDPQVLWKPNAQHMITACKVLFNMLNKPREERKKLLHT